MPIISIGKQQLTSKTEFLCYLHLRTTRCLYLKGSCIVETPDPCQFIFKTPHLYCKLYKYALSYSACLAEGGSHFHRRQALLSQLPVTTSQFRKYWSSEIVSNSFGETLQLKYFVLMAHKANLFTGCLFTILLFKISQNKQEQPKWDNESGSSGFSNLQPMA